MPRRPDGGWHRIEAVKAEIKESLTEFGITHSTLELETIHRAHQEAQLFGHEDTGKDDAGQGDPERS